MKKKSRIFVAGHKGMVGSSIVRELESKGYTNIIVASKNALDLREGFKVNDFFNKVRPEYVFLAAAKVGGIYANMTNKSDFLFDNTLISFNVIYASKNYNVKKLINLGSSCIYPKDAVSPIKENQLLTGKLESTNDAYALAKIAALKLIQFYNEQYKTNFITLMPCNLYGTNDNYNPQTSHVFPALIKKIVDAKLNNEPYINVWGTGDVYREFMHVDDLANACLFIMENYNSTDIGDYVNVGTNSQISIKQLIKLIKQNVQYKGYIKWDTSKPNGVYQKLLDSTKMNELKWKHKITLSQGIRKTIIEYNNLI